MSLSCFRRLCALYSWSVLFWVSRNSTKQNTSLTRSWFVWNSTKQKSFTHMLMICFSNWILHNIVKFFFQLQGYVLRHLAFDPWAKCSVAKLEYRGVCVIDIFLYLDTLIHVTLAFTVARFLCGSKYYCGWKWSNWGSLYLLQNFRFLSADLMYMFS